PQFRSADGVVRDGCGFALTIVTGRHSAAYPARYVRTLAVRTAANGRRQSSGIKRAAVICGPKLLTRRIKGSGGKDLGRGVAEKIVRSRHASDEYVATVGAEGDRDGPPKHERIWIERI